MSESTRQEKKTWWDWADLASKLLVPAVIAFFGWVIATAQFNGQQEAEQLRAQQSTVQAYFDGVQTLLLERGLRRNPEENVDARNLARARTITALDALDKTRSRRVLRFLYETELTQARTPEGVLHPDQLSSEQQPIVSLKFAELYEIDLRRRRLLSEADLAGAYLAEADLSGANLSGANLSGANLTKADLERASGVTWAELVQQTDLLEGATMPNGTKHD
jgi:uncharacterized protein YjbI with pentapeptide repeats